MAITGIHTLLYSSQPDAVREVLRDVFEWDHVDAGNGWLIFATPPAELGVHPAERPNHEISFMCDDIEATVADLAARGIEVAGPAEDMRFGTAVTLRLPGDLEVMLYEPAHPTAINTRAG